MVEHVGLKMFRIRARHVLVRFGPGTAVIVDQDMQPASGFPDRFPDHGGVAFRLEGVEVHGPGPPALGPDGGSRLFIGLRTAAAQVYFGPFGRQRPRAGKPYPSGGGHHQGHPAFQPSASVCAAHDQSP